MTTDDEVSGARPGGVTEGAAAGDVRDGGRRLAVAGERIAEAREAADEVARNENVSDEERRSAADVEDIVGHATGEGAEVAPG